MRTIVTYETHHGTAEKLARIIAKKLDCVCIDVDTPFMAEDETKYDAYVLVFGFRGPYTAQLTKLFLSKMKGKLNNKHVIAVGEGIFSDKEFPSVAASLKDLASPVTFDSHFTRGELRVNTFTFEEKHLLGEFAKLTGMEIKDMGTFNPAAADKIGDDIVDYLSKQKVVETVQQKRFVCTVCGYVHTGDEAPSECPVCHQPKEKFKEM